MDQINVLVDGININATHYSKMDKKAATDDMMFKHEEGAMGLAIAHEKDAAWAGKAWDACSKAVKDAEAAEAKKLAKEKK